MGPPQRRAHCPGWRRVRASRPQTPETLCASANRNPWSLRTGSTVVGSWRRCCEAIPLPPRRARTKLPSSPARAMSSRFSSLLLVAGCNALHEWGRNVTTTGGCVTPGKCTPPAAKYSRVILGPRASQQWNINGGCASLLHSNSQQQLRSRAKNSSGSLRRHEHPAGRALRRCLDLAGPRAQGQP